MLQALEEFLPTTQAALQLVPARGGVSAQERAALTHTSGWATAKVVIVKVRDGFAMAVLPAACALDIGRLKGMIGRGDVRLATIQEIEEATRGCVAGAIPPFGALFHLPTFVDMRLLAGPRHHDAGGRLRHRDPDAREGIPAPGAAARRRFRRSGIAPGAGRHLARAPTAPARELRRARP